jgi:hypothetical protein
MPAKTKSAAKKTGLVAVHLNLPAETIVALDRRVAEVNKGPQWPKLTRTDLIRTVLAEAAAAWAGK